MKDKEAREEIRDIKWRHETNDKYYKMCHVCGGLFNKSYMYETPVLCGDGCRVEYTCEHCQFRMGQKKATEKETK